MSVKLMTKDLTFSIPAKDNVTRYNPEAATHDIIDGQGPTDPTHCEDTYNPTIPTDPTHCEDTATITVVPTDPTHCEDTWYPTIPTDPTHCEDTTVPHKKKDHSNEFNNTLAALQEKLAATLN